MAERTRKAAARDEENTPESVSRRLANASQMAAARDEENTPASDSRRRADASEMAAARDEENNPKRGSRRTIFSGDPLSSLLGGYGRRDLDPLARGGGGSLMGPPSRTDPRLDPRLPPG